MVETTISFPTKLPNVAVKANVPLESNDIELDMKAAIEYAFNKSNQPVILFGSGANGSLSLKLAKENDNVRAVVALSPGEYFLPHINIQDTISNLKKPVFITSSLVRVSICISIGIKCG